MDVISDEKSIEMIHLIFESMVRSKEGRICIQKKKKKNTSTDQMMKTQARVEKENKGINGKEEEGGMNERVELRKDKFIGGVAYGLNFD